MPFVGHLKIVLDVVFPISSFWLSEKLAKSQLGKYMRWRPVKSSLTSWEKIHLLERAALRLLVKWLQLPVQYLVTFCRKHTGT